MTGSFARGELWWVWLGPVVGSEQDGRRPALIVSPTEYNQTMAGRVIVIPVTSREVPLPTSVRVGSASGLDRPSWLLVDQIRAVDKLRLKRFIGMVDQATVDETERMLRYLLFA